MSALLIHLLPGGRAPTVPARAEAADPQGDPFASGAWSFHRAEYLGDPTDWAEDPRLLVLAPASAEDPRRVPVLVDATGLGAPVARIVVTIDYSPIPLALTYRPGPGALPLLGFGVKYEIASALRASAEIGTAQGAARWATAGAFVDALGGGCSAPAVAHSRPDWQEGLGEIRARLWPEIGRLRVAIRHPMDTGLAPGIQAHHLTELALTDATGAGIARLEIHEPVEEDPSLTFLLAPEAARGPVRIEARDNLGYRFAGVAEAAA